MLIEFVGGGRDPLTSDNPFIIGSFLGAVGAVLSLVHSGLSALISTSQRQCVDIALLLILLAWCGFLVMTALNDRAESEGAFQKYCYFAGASYVCGAVLWLICRARMSLTISIALSAAEVGFIGMFLVVTAQMAARSF
jgi:hypothetical protein